MLRRSISSEVLGLKKKRLKRPGLKVISMYFCYFKLEMGESEQEDMNPERQRDVRVERRGCEVSVRRACCVCVKYLSHQQCEFSQTPRFNSKQTQLFFFFFFHPLALKLKKQNHRGGEAGSVLGRFADPCRRFSVCFVSKRFL